MARRIKAVKCALRFNPPLLALYYDDLTRGKRRRRSMPLRDFTGKTNVETYLESLLVHPRHGTYFSTIPRHQLLALLQRMKLSEDSGKAVKDIEQTPSHTLDLTLDESLPKVGPLLSLADAAKSPQKVPSMLHIDDQLERILSGGREKISDSEEEGESFSNTKLDLLLMHTTDGTTEKPDTPPHTSSLTKRQGDKAHTSGVSDLKSLPPLTSSGVSTSNQSPLLTSAKSLSVPTHEEKKALRSGHQPTLFNTELPESYADDYEDDEDSSPRTGDAKESNILSLSQEALSELSEEFSNISEGGPLEPLMSSDALKTIEDLQIVSGEEDNQMGEDFNQMTETDYEKRKAQMEVEFQQQRIKPGDSGFVYDKQVDFDTGGKIESGWDSGDSSTSEF